MVRLCQPVEATNTLKIETTKSTPATAPSDTPVMNVTFLTGEKMSSVMKRRYETQVGLVNLSKSKIMFSNIIQPLERELLEKKYYNFVVSASRIIASKVSNFAIESYFLFSSLFNLQVLFPWYYIFLCCYYKENSLLVNNKFITFETNYIYNFYKAS